MIHDPGVRDGERQGAHSILSSDDRRETRVESKEHILGDGFGVINALETQVAQNTGREFAIGRGEALGEGILVRRLSA
jgi:hypothetical protein